MDEELDNKIETLESENQSENNKKNTTNKINTTVQKVKNAAQKAGKAVAKAGKAAVKTVGKVFKSIFTNPIVLKILLITGIFILIIVFIAGIIAAIAYAFIAPDYDAEKGLLSSIHGITSDKFYGARLIYQDDEAANLEIQENYLNYTYNILNDTKSETGLTISLSADYTTDVNIIEITTNYANALINNSGNDKYTLGQCISKIDHFGFSNSEITIVIDSITNTLKSNSSGITWASKDINTIKSALTSKSQEENYSIYKIVMSKIYVWDYILEDEDSTLNQLPKKDYIGFVYMPKEEVTMTYTSFIFVVKGGYGVDVCLFKKEEQNILPFNDPKNANVTWFKDNHAQEIYECEFNEELQPFTAIDTNNINALATPTSIFTLIKNDTYSTYFDQVEDYNGLTLIQNIADSEYIFLYMDNKDENRSPFNFAEAIVNYD